jgi:hypothetical protein
MRKNPNHMGERKYLLQLKTFGSCLRHPTDIAFVLCNVM